MSRPKFAARISLRGRSGKTVPLTFAAMADGRIAIYRNGRISDKHPCGNATEIGRLIAGWLRKQV